MKRCRITNRIVYEYMGINKKGEHMQYNKRTNFRASINNNNCIIKSCLIRCVYNNNIINI